MIISTSLVVALLVAEPATPREIAWPDATAPAATAEAMPRASVAGEVLLERCDGTRTPTRADAGLECTRWKIEWSKDGKIWGVSSASTLAALVTERERLLGYARQHARLFDAPVDARWNAPTAPLCDACDPARATTPGVPAAPSADDPTQTAWLDARLALVRLETHVLDVHVARIREIARLAHEPATARLAKAYAKQLEVAVIDLARLQLELDNAAIFRSSAAIARIAKATAARAKALDDAGGALSSVVAKAVARVHAGRYADDASTDANRAQLVVAFVADKVTATLVVGEAESQWFEGTVQLDGSIVGRSLVAPEAAALTCNAHALECGYVWAPAMLRFADREDSRGKQHLVELWFQQSKWVHAKPFARQLGGR